MGGVHHPKPVALVQHLDSNIKSDRNRLNNLQRWFVRLILQVPQSTPAPALTWETGLIDMRLRIWKEKLMLILHIRSLEGTALAGEVRNIFKASVGMSEFAGVAGKLPDRKMLKFKI